MVVSLDEYDRAWHEYRNQARDLANRYSGVPFKETTKESMYCAFDSLHKYYVSLGYDMPMITARFIGYDFKVIVYKRF